jgi:hypothetical protein
MYMTSLWVWIMKKKNRNTGSDFADEPNGSPNGGRIVCARCVSWEGHVDETPELQLHGMQASAWACVVGSVHSAAVQKLQTLGHSRVWNSVGQLLFF